MRDYSGYAPISDYGFLSDCRSAALVGMDGSIDWLCWPRFDSPSLFGRLLDQHRGGYFSITPTDPYTIRRAYIPETMVLQTTFTTATGVIRLDDWLHTGARQSLCRLIQGLEGAVELDIICDPRPQYGAEGAMLWSERMGYLVCDLSDPYRLILDGLEVSAEAFIEVDEEQRVIRPRNILTVAMGEHVPLSLGLNRPGPSDLLSSRRRTGGFWKDWCEDLTLPERAREHVTRSALTLKGLQYSPSGAIVAAATTSLPETIGGERNYDYRFSWLRDAAFTLYALRAVGKDDEAQSWFDWLKGLALYSGNARLNIMYGIEGESDLTEYTLDHLEGYRHSTPVRIGNGAAKQRQIDTYGELLDAIWLQRKASKTPMNPHRALFVTTLAERAIEEWQEPDEGIWEIRGPAQHFVYSKVMCWVALDRAIRICRSDPHVMHDAPLEKWRKERDTIKEEIFKRGYNTELGVFTMAYDSEAIDAANLLLAQVGFVRAHDPRFIRTVRMTQEKLSSNGMVYRYSQEAIEDGFEGEEGSFAICSLWLVLALTQIGEVAAASALFTQILDCANDLGLLAEQLTPEGEQLGNFPQAFTHIAVIACAFALDRAERKYGINTEH